MDTPRSSYPTFSWTERRGLLRALEQAHDARLYRRLRAVAEIAEGESVAVVAKHARVERSTVYRWIERYLAERAPSALADGKRSGRPRMTPVRWLAKFGQVDKWKFCLRAARMPLIRSDNDKKIGRASCRERG